MEGLEFGADDYLTKPFSWTELQLRIKNILRNRELLHQRWKNAAPTSPEIGIFISIDEKLLREIVRVINQNIDEPDFSVEILATEVGLSWVHLYRKMKSLTGESPKAYINKVRLQKAYQLLEQGNRKPAEVAVVVGYYDVKYFGKSFKKFFGESPSQVSLTTVG